ncbi:MAG TPA: serine hydrolase [Chitinophagaceae bacterium]|jgi:CubicO group peptidase (beta-lactamase class C family)|nr:serine hydrolase [Chitinophagaceae bacterium]
MRNAFLLFSLVFILSCQKGSDGDNTPDPPAPTPMYFPPVGSTEWQTTSVASLGWNQTQLDDLYTYLQSKGTKAFIILKNGKIVTERYFGTFTSDSIWYWASAGKTMTAMLVGIAQQEGLLNINNKTSQYLGTGWTSLSLIKENLITVRHQLTMTTGLDDAVTPDNDCTSPSCLVYKADAGTRWAYHNAPYTLLDKVVESATGTTYNNYFQQKIRDRIGMNGVWLYGGGWNNVYYSNARSMARFGLLLLNKGKWDQTTILSDTGYFNMQTNTSQSYNNSYGYLTWLNGKANYMLPGLQVVFNGPLVPNATSDMFSALGKNDQKIYVVPSQKLTVIRMGESAGNVQLALSSFDNEMWGKLKLVIGY